MRHFFLTLLNACKSLIFLLPILSAHTGRAQSGPPKARMETVTDSYSGITVGDKYRWLENLENPEAKSWYKAQADYTKSILDRIPGRDSLIQTLMRYDKMQPASYNAVKSRAGRYFFRKTLPGENISKLYLKDGENGAEVLLFDPSQYEDKKGYYIVNFLPSDDGKMVAVAIGSGGGEISNLRVLNVSKKQFLPDLMAPVREEFTWTPDGKGILYTQLNSADPFDVNFQLNTQAKYHRLGTASSQDPVLLSSSKYPALHLHPTEVPMVYFSNDRTQLLANLNTVDVNKHVLTAPAADLLLPDIRWKELISRTDSVAGITDVHGKLFLHSLKGAPNGRILVTSLAKPDIKNAKIAVPEGRKIYEISPSRDFVLITKDDVTRSYLETYEAATGKLKELDQPMTGINGFWAFDPNGNDCQVIIISWLKPAVAYLYKPVSQKFEISRFYAPAAYPGLDELTSEEIEIPGHDGVMLPLTILHKKNFKKDGKSVCFMTGYGSYGVSGVPHFDPKYLALLNQNVVVAITHPRGGGEKGLNWYKAGFKANKPNTWKDFISSGDYLVRNGYTSANHLIGEGTSAGGILIGRAITERPDLFAAAISNVGVNNALRFELTPNSDNIAEFGTFKNPDEAKALYEMDALYHVKDGVNYPAVICVGGMNDPRVIVWQPGKFAAALQNATASGKPVLLQLNYDNGHFTEDKAVMFRNFANMYAFALWQAGHEGFGMRN